MIVDAHQHFWQLARGDYRFPRPDDRVLHHDFLPEMLAPILGEAGVSSTVLVQATDTLAETAFLLDLAARSAFIAGVVGWWDPRTPDALDDLLRLPGRAKLVGVRPMLQGLADISWLLAPHAVAELARLAGLGLVFDALVEPRQLSVIANLSRRLPHLKIVIDHMGKPWRTPGVLGDWAAAMADLATLENCAVKISGFPFAAGPPSPAEALDVIVALLRQRFGAARLLWGSDWPVVEREGGYAMALARMRLLIPEAAQPAVFGNNAISTYGLKIGAGMA